MTAKTEYVRARITAEDKKAVGSILSKLGIGHTEAIRLFYQQVIMNKGLPFKVKIPNRKTRQALRDVKLGRNLKTYNTAKELFDKYR